MQYGLIDLSEIALTTWVRCPPKRMHGAEQGPRRTSASVVQLCVDLILKLAAIYALPAAPGARGVPHLYHKVAYDAVDLQTYGLFGSSNV